MLRPLFPGGCAYLPICDISSLTLLTYFASCAGKSVPEQLNMIMDVLGAPTEVRTNSIIDANLLHIMFAYLVFTYYF